MLPKKLTPIFFFLSWAFASSDLSPGREDGASDVRTEVPDLSAGSPTDHELWLAPKKDTEVVGLEQRITVTYAGSKEMGLLDDVNGSKISPSNATGRKYHPPPLKSTIKRHTPNTLQIKNKSH